MYYNTLFIILDVNNNVCVCVCVICLCDVNLLTMCVLIEQTYSLRVAFIILLYTVCTNA